MASTLRLTKPDIDKEVAAYLGYQRDASKWTTEQTADINAAVDSGTRLFYGSHDWTFTKKIGTITTVSGTSAYDLPDDFGAPDGIFTFPADTGYPPLLLVGEQEIRDRQSRVETDGYPDRVAIRMKEGTGTSEQLWEAVLYPTPNLATTISFKYSILPDKLTAASPFPLGGAGHAESLKAACLAAAEKMRDGVYGHMYDDYMSRWLPISIRRDGRILPETYGYNSNRHSHSQRAVGHSDTAYGTYDGNYSS